MFSCPYEERCKEYLQQNNLKSACDLGADCGYFNIFYTQQFETFLKNPYFSQLIASMDERSQKSSDEVTRILKKTRRG